MSHTCVFIDFINSALYNPRIFLLKNNALSNDYRQPLLSS